MSFHGDGSSDQRSTPVPDSRVLRPKPGTAVAELRGEYDLNTQEPIDALFSSLVDENELVVVDLSEAQFIDSSFLRSLVKAHRLAEEGGSKFRLQLGTKPIIEKVLQISGLLSFLDCAPTREQALGPGGG